MKVFIKEFSVEQEIKTKGIELGILSPDGKRHIGDLIVTKTGVEWCKGKVRRGCGCSGAEPLAHTATLVPRAAGGQHISAVRVGSWRGPIPS